MKTLIAMLLASTALVVRPAQASETPVTPTGGSVVAGQAVIGGSGNGALQIVQSTQHAVINWQDFSIGQGGRVDIVQPSSTAALLNRVTSQTTSTIAGTLSANGQVFLVNPNGILITANGSIKAAGFVASSLDIATSSFMSGERSFSGGAAAASVTNAGTIQVASGGFAALLGGNVANVGLIAAPMGHVALASGDTVTLDFGGLLAIEVPEQLLTGRSEDGGLAILSASDAIDAARRTVNFAAANEAVAVSQVGGRIVLSGVIDVSAPAGTGGSVTVAARDISLVGAKIDASGAGGGGTVRIGGGKYGAGGLAHAETLAVDAGSLIDASATTGGAGGEVVLWSDMTTSFAGTILARGLDGAGGDAEVSSTGVLDYRGLTDLTGTRFGTLLLDPHNVIIYNSGNSGPQAFTATADDSEISTTTLTNALQTANVTVSTGSTGNQAGNIIVADAVRWSSGGTLTLDAAGDIFIGAPIEAAAGGLTVRAGAGIRATGGISVARFTLAGGDWVQTDTAPAPFAAADFRITGGSFLRASGGTGVSADPYRIFDVYGLQGIGSSSALLASNYLLVNDLDAHDTAIWNFGAGFTPIGTDIRPPSDEDGLPPPTATELLASFQGNFDGGGYAIDGLTIRGQNNVGLFGFSTGAIHDISLTGVDIIGTGSVGALAGSIFGGTVKNAFSSGSVVATSTAGGLIGAVVNGSIESAHSNVATYANDTVGGLIGYAQDVAVSASYATGVVRGPTFVGGLIGYADRSIIARSYATGPVFGGGFGTGGLVGVAEAGTQITRSYASGAVSGSNTVGGLVGRFSGDFISQAYATGSVTGSDDTVGGLAGYVGGNSAIDQTYASGAVTGSGAGGLVGLAAGSPTITNSYWDIDTTGRATSQGGGTGLSQEQARGQSAYVGFNFESDWYQALDTRPIGRWEANAAGADGSIAIDNVHQLQLIDVHPFANYRLTADLDASVARGSNASGIWGPGGFVPIGQSLDFFGTFDGDQHAIDGLVITRPDDSFVGLFQSLFGTVRNVGLTNVTIVGRNNVGALAGSASLGSISGAWSSGSVVGDNNTGGLVGLTSLGSISDSHSSATVNILSDSPEVGVAGGLVGFLNATNVTNSYAEGAVTGKGNVGGLVGYASSANITRSFATGNVSGISAVGGLVGYTFRNALAQVYATGRVEGTQFIGGLVGFGQTISIRQAYATGSTVGLDYVGGLVGIMFSGGAIGSFAGAIAFDSTVQQAYASGSVTGTSYVGGLIGYSVTPAIATNSYWDIDTTGQTASAGGTGLTQVQARDAASYAGFDFSAGWYQSLDMRPIGRWEANAAGADGFVAVGNLHQLQLMDIDLSANYRLTADIDASPTEGADASGIWGTGGFVPVGRGSAPFTGNFDGRNHGIEGLTINRRDTGDAGLFGATRGGELRDVALQDASIKSLGRSGILAGSVDGGTIVNVYSSGTVGLLDSTYTIIPVGGLVGALVDGSIIESRSYANVFGDLFAGGLVGQLDRSTITASRASGLVSALGYSGGLVGQSTDSTIAQSFATGSVDAPDGRAGGLIARAINSVILQSYASGNVRGSTGTGGLVGDSSASVIRQSYATGSVWSDAAYIGGLVGSAFNSTIDQSYSVGKVTLSVGNPVDRRVGGLVGVQTGSQVTDSYWDTTTSGFTTSAGGIGLTTAQMQDLSAFRSNFAGFDFDSVWAPPNQSGQNNMSLAAHYPELYALSRIVAVTPVTGTSVYGNITGVAQFASYSGIRSNDYLTALGSFTTNATNISNVGRYAIRGEGAALTDAGYRIIYVPGIYDITARPLTVIADAFSRIYGDDNPVRGSASADNLVNGDTIGSVALVTPATTASGVGAYDLTAADAQGTGVSNYLISYATNRGGLTIGKASLVVSATPFTRYYGDVTPARGGATADGIRNGDTVDTVALSTPATAASKLGFYEVTVSDVTGSGLGNYNVVYLTNPNALSIIARPLTITADPLSRIYGDATPARGTATGDNLVNGDTIGSVALVTPATTASGVAAYDLTGSDAIGSGLDNYVISYATNRGGLTIGKASLVVSATPFTRYYGDMTPARGGATADGIRNGDTVDTVALSTPATAASKLGFYEVTVSDVTGSGLGNYNVVYLTNPNALSIIARPLTITADPLSRIYGDATPARGTATGDNLVNGDTIGSVALATPATTASGVGAYDLTVADAQGTGLGNYLIRYSTNKGALTISPRAVAITADPKSRQAGYFDPVFTYTLKGGGLVNGDSLSGELGSTATVASVAGRYAITLGSMTAGVNYKIDFTGAVLSVLRMPVVGSSIVRGPAWIGLRPVDESGVLAISPPGSPSDQLLSSPEFLPRRLCSKASQCIFDPDARTNQGATTASGSQ